jgi:lauroyl/myristoyl acyltransferase
LTKVGIVARTQQLLHAFDVLSKGQMVLIAGDGRQGFSHPAAVSFHGRTVPFMSGFSELARKSGASVVPVMTALTPEGVPLIAFDPPLPGDRSSPGSEQQEQCLLQQYADQLARHWAEFPWSIPPFYMRLFTECPKAPTDNPGAAKPQPKTQKNAI